MKKHQEVQQRVRYLSLPGQIAAITFPCYLKLLGAVIEIILSSPGLLQHLCTLLFLHLLFVLQICHFLILVFNLPVKEKSRTLCQPQHWAAGLGKSGTLKHHHFFWGSLTSHSGSSFTLNSYHHLPITVCSCTGTLCNLPERKTQTNTT